LWLHDFLRLLSCENIIWSLNFLECTHICSVHISWKYDISGNLFHEQVTVVQNLDKVIKQLNHYSNWITISIGKSGWCSGHQSRLPPLLQMLYVDLSFSRSQPDWEAFLPALRVPPSSKLTPSLIQFAGPHW